MHIPSVLMGTRAQSQEWIPDVLDPRARLVPLLLYDVLPL